MNEIYNEIMADEIKKITKQKKDLTFLGLYLSQEKNVSALKILNWLTIAIQENWIDKEIEINKKITVSENDYYGKILTHQENIPSRLIENPIFVAKEALDYMAKTNKIDFNFRPHKSYSLKEMMTKNLVDFQNPESEIYQMDKAVHKTLEILAYFSEHGTMNINNTMKCFLKQAMAQDIDIELKKLIVRILSASRNPHIKYDDRINENLEIEKRHLLQEEQNRYLNERDYRYYKNILEPKLTKKQIKLK